MEINEIIRRVREDKDMTQENLADAIKVHVTTLNRYEKNKRTIPGNKLEKIAAAFNMTVADLYSYKENPSLLEEPIDSYKRGKNVSVLVQLDGTVDNLNSWFSTLKKLNAAI